MINVFVCVCILCWFLDDSDGNGRDDGRDDGG